MILALDPRRRELFMAIVAGLSGQFASLLVPILVMPALLVYLGEVNFGIWATGVALCGLAAFMDFGIGNSLLTKISEAHALGKYDMICRYLASAYASLTIVCFAGLAFLEILSRLSIQGLFASDEGWSIVRIVLSAFFLTLPLSIVYRTLYAFKRIPIHSLLQVLGAALAVVGCFLAINADYGAETVVALYSFAQPVVMALSTIWFFRTYSNLRPRWIDLTRATTIDIVGMGSKFFILAILTSIGTNADILIISIIAGPEAVANFVPPMRIGSVLAVLITNLFLPLWSFNGDALARKEFDWVRRNTRFMSFAGGLLIACAGSALVVLSTDLMMIWMGRMFEGQKTVLIGMVLSATVIAVTSPYNMILNSQGMASVQIYPWVAFVMLSVTAKVLLSLNAQVEFIPFASAVTYLIILSPTMMYYASRTLSRRAQ